MRQEIYDLIDAVRGLGLELTDRDPPKCVRIKGDTGDFWLRLERVQKALEAVDADGALSEGGDGLEPRNDPEKLRAALDGVMRLFQLQGGNLQEAIDMVRDKMGLDGGEKKKKGYVTLPFFAPNSIRKKGKYKPRLRLLPERPEDVTLDDLRKMAFEVEVTEALVGSTYRQPRVRDKDRELIESNPAPSMNK
ncbi:hypothetical protein G6L37_03875 [Agrobacterium rubi]|nr:hypothetical protein [Agrobacterium rubi]NTF24488.1 hypothetical protein [Agrobacterium rubi]